MEMARLRDMEIGRKRLMQLDRLIAAGWGYHPGKKIPAHVQRAAADPRSVVPQADLGEAKRYERSCHDEAGNVTAPRPAQAKVCVICGAEHHRHIAAKTCSYVCSEKLREKTLAIEAQRRVVSPTEQICVQCGSAFLGYKGNRLCSDKCRVERRRAHYRKEIETRSDNRRRVKEMVHGSSSNGSNFDMHWHVL